MPTELKRGPHLPKHSSCPFELLSSPHRAFHQGRGAQTDVKPCARRGRTLGSVGGLSVLHSEARPTCFDHFVERGHGSFNRWQ
jgi:hypothetical protein